MTELTSCVELTCFMVRCHHHHWLIPQGWRSAVALAKCCRGLRIELIVHYQRRMAVRRRETRPRSPDLRRCEHGIPYLEEEGCGEPRYFFALSGFLLA